jgi:LacI family transcriptional regulator
LIRSNSRTKELEKNITLADVALAAGVAPMTVSRFLNNHPNISEKTAKKVSTAIKRLGYTPNLAARILAGQSSHAIGVIVPSLEEAFYSELVHHIQVVARARGILVWIGTSEADPSTEAAIISRMNQQGIDGIIMIPCPGRNMFDPQKLRVPLVVLDRPLRNGTSDSVFISNRLSAREGVEHLIGHGCKRIYCLSTYTAEDFTNAERISGYEDALRSHKLPVEILANLNTQESVIDAVSRVLNIKGGHPAIFTTHTRATVQVLLALQKKGVDVPGELSFLGFDDVPMAELLRPGPTVIVQPVAALAAQASRLLFGHIDTHSNSTEEPVTVTLGARLVIRESCGCTGS